MTIGPGKYDDLCRYAREHAGAAGAVLLVIGGTHGSGLSVQASAGVQMLLPELLEELAQAIRADLNGGTAQ
jgi:hypothetical protein